MAYNHMNEALTVTRGLGIPDQEVIPVYKNLLKVYGDNLEFIAEENYRALVDAYFEQKDDSKEGEVKGMKSGKEPERFLSVGKEERVFPKLDHTSKKPISKESKTPLTSSRPQLSKPSKPSESKYRLVHPPPRSNVENSNFIEQVKNKISLNKPPTAKPFDRPLGEPSSLHVSREKKLLPKSSNEKHYSPLSPRPISTIHPELQNPPVTVGVKMDNPPLKVGVKMDNPPLKKANRCENGDTHPFFKVQKKPYNFLEDISKGTEKVGISLLDEIGNERIPKFNYIPQSIIYQNANINISLARIVDEDCCSSCSGDCLSSSLPCACACETGGEFAYTPQGLLKEKFLKACIDMKEQPEDHHFVYCTDCPIERSRNDDKFEKCKGHLVRKFIKECWRKCGCDMKCGNRVVQRGISRRLQVFFTSEGKGWGVRPLDPLPEGAFVCEYIGEVLTNMELYNRNKKSSKDRHTYPVTLDADWGSEGFLKDEEALCLDGTYHGNVSRFINHRCSDPNLVDIPVEVETPDRHFYHLAFFTTRKVAALEELTWDYGIDFNDKYHPIKAFRCSCGSPNCRDKTRKRLVYYFLSSVTNFYGHCQTTENTMTKLAYEYVIAVNSN
ncbi:histone-lysine N-methyltransferase SUVR4 isoform X2 [Cannabis sativa]|uniref:histone-lysine N-methyltransferase SUVR4 isoform X2 n=1 Tax=Cannabis sativa TaxID=3483 RepID=UPI0029CA0A12|nr:histone-lysine N-methyltransferase SUVR4 isoform X2 [Cannabis sativa]XP_060966280.1 histone-lysine N-methyltransferase SUVR4 isoform X2 [Cannabis sativa]